MTTFNLDGPIVEIVTAASIGIANVSCGALQDGSPATLTRSANTTIVLLSYSGPIDSTHGPAGFQIDGSFGVGDVLELYNDDPNRESFQVLDENGNNIASPGLENPGIANNLNGAIYRKLRTGSGRNWGFTT